MPPGADVSWVDLLLFDSGEADGFLFYVMPRVEGESLRERLDRQKQLQIDEAVHHANAIASALDYAHRRHGHNHTNRHDDRDTRLRKPGKGTKTPLAYRELA